MEFLDAGGGVVGKVDVCAGEGVGDAGGGDVLGWVSVSFEPLWTREVSVLGVRVEIGHRLRGLNGDLGVVHVEKVSRRIRVPVRSPPSRSLISTFFQLSSFALRSTTSSIPAEESIARTETSGKDFLTSAVTVPRPQPSSRTTEVELGGKVWVA